MKSVLAIETSSACCSVALSHQGKTSSRQAIGERVHHAELLPMIDAVLAEQGVKSTDLDGVLLSIGPGSFTGVRIGVSVAQSFSFAHDLPILPLSSVWILAQTAFLQNTDQAPLAVAIDARMNAAYCGQYEAITWNHQKLVIPKTTEQLCTLAEFSATLPSDIFLAGDAWTDVALQQLHRDPQMYSAAHPLASSMPLLAAYALAHGATWRAPEAAQPVYLDKDLYKR